MQPLNKVTRVWTFQAEEQLQVMLRDGLLQGDWSRICPEAAAAYRVMCREMAARGLPCEGRPPVWGWHSCGGYQQAPGAEVARQLLSDHQLTDTTIVLLAFECPIDQVLPSAYNVWCEQVYFPLAANAAFTPAPGAAHGLFDIDYRALEEDALIQTVSSCLRREWLVEARYVRLDPHLAVHFEPPWRPI